MLILPIPFEKLIEGREAAITANQRDLAAFNEIQAGQLQNALDMELFTPRVNNAFNDMEAGFIRNAGAYNDLATSDMDLILRGQQQPLAMQQQQDFQDAYGRYGRDTLFNRAATGLLGAGNAAGMAQMQQDFLMNPNTYWGYQDAYQAELKSRQESFRQNIINELIQQGWTPPGQNNQAGSTPVTNLFPQ